MQATTTINKMEATNQQRNWRNLRRPTGGDDHGGGGGGGGAGEGGGGRLNNGANGHERLNEIDFKHQTQDDLHHNYQQQQQRNQTQHNNYNNNNNNNNNHQQQQQRHLISISFYINCLIQLLQATKSQQQIKASIQDNHHHQIKHNHHQHKHCFNNNYFMLARKQLVSTIALITLISSAMLIITIEAKPINQYQIKFRRLPPKEFSAALGSSITIECEAGGSPPPTIHWLKDGKRLQQSDFDDNQLDAADPLLAAQGVVGAVGGGGGRANAAAMAAAAATSTGHIDDVNRMALSTTRSRLFIDCADNQDEAVYTCVAENAYSRISSHTRLSLIKPVLAVEAASTSDELAAALGELDPNGTASDNSNSNNSNNNNNRDEPLAAMPQCLSQRATRAAVPSSSSSADSVRIHMWTHNIVEIQRNNVLLYCRSNMRATPNTQQQQQSQITPTTTTTTTTDELNNNIGNNSNNRMPVVSWVLPDEKLVTAEQKDKYEILETGDLLIKDLHWSDMGSYVCTVSDEQSSDSVSSFVYPASSNKAKQNKRSIGTLNQQLLATRHY